MKTAELTQVISNDRRLDLLTGAIEGGSNYWYWIGDNACNRIGFIAPSDGQTPFVDRMWRTLLNCLRAVLTN